MARSVRSELTTHDVGDTWRYGSTEETRLTRASGRAPGAPGAVNAAAGRVSALPSAEARTPRLRELWLVQRPRGRPHQAEGQARRRCVAFKAPAHSAPTSKPD